MGFLLKTIPKILETYKPNLMIECYKKMDATFVLDEKVQVMTDIYQSLIGISNKDFEQAINDASLVFHVLCFPDSQDTYSDNIIFK